MKSRILVFGAPGSFSEKLADQLSSDLGLEYLNLFDLFPLPEKVHQHENNPELFESLTQLLKGKQSYLFHGSLIRLDLANEEFFDQVIFTHAPRLERISNLREKHLRQDGEKILEEGTREFRLFNQKMYWASQYDQGGMDRESKILHDDFCRKTNLTVHRFRAYQDARWSEQYEILLNEVRST